jgi:Aconitate B N-terminal domain
MLEAYRQHTADRAALGIPPLPLDAEQTSALCELLQHPPAGEEANLIALLRDWALPSMFILSIPDRERLHAENVSPYIDRSETVISLIRKLCA